MSFFKDNKLEILCLAALLVIWGLFLVYVS